MKVGDVYKNKKEERMQIISVVRSETLIGDAVQAELCVEVINLDDEIQDESRWITLRKGKKPALMEINKTAFSKLRSVNAGRR